MKKLKYKNIWISLVNIKSKEGFSFMDLTDTDDDEALPYNYVGAWGNILVKSDNIKSALDIISQGLDELHFEVVFIDKIENINSLIEKKELKESVVSEVQWLQKSDYVFLISDKLFPYE